MEEIVVLHTSFLAERERLGERKASGKLPVKTVPSEGLLQKRGSNFSRAGNVIGKQRQQILNTYYVSQTALGNGMRHRKNWGNLN